MVTIRKYKNGFNQRTYNANKRVALDKSIEKKYKDLLQERKDVFREAQRIQNDVEKRYRIELTRKVIPKFDLMEFFTDQFQDFCDGGCDYDDYYGDLDNVYYLIYDFLVKGGNSSEYRSFYEFDREGRKMYVGVIEFGLDIARVICETYVDTTIPLALEKSRAIRNNSIKVRARKFNRPTIPRFKGYNTKCSCKKSSKRR